jgi:hypothetical protein
MMLKSTFIIIFDVIKNNHDDVDKFYEVPSWSSDLHEILSSPWSKSWSIMIKNHEIDQDDPKSDPLYRYYSAYSIEGPYFNYSTNSHANENSWKDP